MAVPLSVGAGPIVWADVSRSNRSSYRSFLVLTIAVVAFFALLTVSAWQGYLVDRWANQTNAIVATFAVIEVLVLWTFLARYLEPIARDPPIAVSVRGREVQVRLRSGRVERLNLQMMCVESRVDAVAGLVRWIASRSRRSEWLRWLRPDPWFSITFETFEALRAAAEPLGLRAFATPIVDLGVKRGERFRFEPANGNSN